MRQSEFPGVPIDAPLAAVLTVERANPMGNRSVAAAQGLLQVNGEAERDAYLRALVADAVRHLDVHLGPHAIDVIQEVVWDVAYDDSVVAELLGHQFPPQHR